MTGFTPITTKIGRLTVTSPAKGQVVNEITISPEKINPSGGMYNFAVGSSDQDAIKVDMPGLGNFKTQININASTGEVLVNNLGSTFSTSIVGHNGSFGLISDMFLSKTPEVKQKYKDTNGNDKDAYKLTLAVNNNVNKYKLSLSETWSLCVSGLSVTLDSDGKGNLTVKKLGVTPVGSLYFAPPPPPVMASVRRIISQAGLAAMQSN